MKKIERPCEFEDLTKEYFNVLFPALKHAARRCGYALSYHGSLKTDIDLIASPWRERPVSPEYVAAEIRKVAEAIIGICEDRKTDINPTEKPNGRLAWSFWLVPVGCRGPYIDLSVFTPSNEVSNAESND